MSWRIMSAVLALALAVPGLAKETENKDKINIAHRGASGYLPEHTLEAASLAHGMRADFIEPDLVLTKDNEVIILHDLRLDTTTNVSKIFPERKRKDGHWYAIDFTLAEIKRLGVGERRLKSGKAAYPGRFPVKQMNFKVPTLKEFIGLVQGLNRSTGRKTGIYPELKEPLFHKKAGKDITKIVYGILREEGYEDNPGQIFIQCFDPAVLIRLKNEFKTRIPLIQLIGMNSWWKEPPADFDAMRTREGLRKIAHYASGIGPWTGHILQKHQHGNIVTSSGLVARAHAEGLLVHAYTARADALPAGIESYQELLELLFFKENTDGLFSDFPDITRRFLNKRSEKRHKQSNTFG